MNLATVCATSTPLGLFPHSEVVRPRPRRRPEPRASARHPLTAMALSRRLEDEGLPWGLSLVPALRELAAYNRNVFGFGFEVESLRIPAEEADRIVLGLKGGCVSRPLVLDSPSSEHARRLGLDPAASLLSHRVRSLAASGMRFLEREARLSVWKDLRGASRIWAGAAWSVACRAHQDSPIVTVASRLDQQPRLMFVSTEDGPSERNVLVEQDGTASVARVSRLRQAGQLGARVLSPEASVLLLGLPDLRDDVSSLLASQGPLGLGGLATFGRFPTIQSTPSGVVLGWTMVDDPDPLYRVNGSTE